MWYDLEEWELESSRWREEECQKVRESAIGVFKSRQDPQDMTPQSQYPRGNRARAGGAGH